MFNISLKILYILDAILWDYITIIIILILGLWLTFTSSFFQFKYISHLKKNIYNNFDLAFISDFLNILKSYFISLGGMVGLGNIVTISTTLAFGGPGSIVWLWIASFIGIVIKYSEVYLGIKYRIIKNNISFGGPMYYLNIAFKNKFISIFICFLLCIYCTEVSQFSIISDSIINLLFLSNYFIHFNTFSLKLSVIFFLFFLIIIISSKNTKYFSTLCVVIMPIFIILYFSLCFYIIYNNLYKLPSVFSLIFHSFFSLDPYSNGIIPASVFSSIHYGFSRSFYSGDIGIGYDSIMQSDNILCNPSKNAKICIFSLITDSLICTLSIIVLLITDVWTIDNLQSTEYIICALKIYMPFPYAEYFIFIIFILTGFTTITGYFIVGQKCANYINPRYGKTLYLIYSFFSFMLFSFLKQDQVILIMSVSGGFITIINLIGIFILRKKIFFY